MKDRKKKFFNFKVDVKSAVPVYEQVKRTIKFAILSGYLQDGDKLLSLRELAMKLQINPNTIIKIYTQLEFEGYIYSRPGAGYYVKIDPGKVKKGKYELLEKETLDYISRVTELGFSMDDITAVIHKYFKGERHDTD